MIGIMADSHDNLFAVKKAVQLFKDAGCELVIHGGDFVAPFAARELENLNCQVKAVFGNCDGEKKGLEKALSSFGEIQESPLLFSHDGLDFFVTHVPSDLKRHAASGKHDIIIFAHTHTPEVRKKGKTLLINPGETGGWVSGKSTVALLDTKTISAEILSL
jgi:putative phosphoesterase